MRTFNLIVLATAAFFGAAHAADCRSSGIAADIPSIVCDSLTQFRDGSGEVNVANVTTPNLTWGTGDVPTWTYNGGGNVSTPGSFTAAGLTSTGSVIVGGDITINEPDAGILEITGASTLIVPKKLQMPSYTGSFLIDDDNGDDDRLDIYHSSATTTKASFFANGSGMDLSLQNLSTSGTMTAGGTVSATGFTNPSWSGGGEHLSFLCVYDATGEIVKSATACNLDL